VVHRGLVVQRRGDGLELEGHLLEAHLARGGFQRRLGLGVARRVVVDEEHRPAQHRARDGVAGLALGQGLEVAQVAGDDLQKGHRMALAQVGALLDQRGAQHALHRAHQPALDAVHIGAQRGAAVQAIGRLVGARSSSA
jgi:hypothetical protein